MVDGGEPGVDSRDEGKHTGRNDLLEPLKVPRGKSKPKFVCGYDR